MIDARVGVTAADEVFAEIIALADDCRFSDCAHQSEPGCAVIAAVAELVQREQCATPCIAQMGHDSSPRVAEPR